MTKYEDMKKHLLTQFTNSKNLQAILYALSMELDEINEALKDLKNKRWINTGEGKQLDGIGTIVDRDRYVKNAVALQFFGFVHQTNTAGFGQARFKDYNEPYLSSTRLEDPEYRLLLWMKVFKNNSYATYEDTIRSLQYIFGVDLIFTQDIGNAKFIVGIGKLLSKNEILMANAVDLLIRGGGVGIKFISNFDKNVFGFKHQKIAKGFGVGSFASSVYGLENV